MKMIALLIAVAAATPAIAQDTTPASTQTAPAAAAPAPDATTYPPCSATVTDQCIERVAGGHGHRWHHRHK